MKQMSNIYTYSNRRARRYAYPNEADPSYFIGKIRNGFLAALTSLCTVTFFLYLVTI